jgi:transcriptional regulator with XRE-family HTH domain
LGLELRQLREAAALTIEVVAEYMNCSSTKISRIENGRVTASPRDVRNLLDLYGVSDHMRDQLLTTARLARQKSWWEAYGRDLPVVTFVGLEAGAASIRQYAALLVPGLLQTADYAGLVLRAVRPDLPIEQIERRVELRMARQSILDADDAPTLHVVLDEAALRRPIGGPEGYARPAYSSS